MTAKLHTPNYRIPDLELITGFEVRQGEEFTIELKDLPGGSDWLTNEDPVLQVAPRKDAVATEDTISVKALKRGSSEARTPFRSSDSSTADLNAADAGKIPTPLNTGC